MSRERDRPVTEKSPPQSKLRQVRLLIWLLVALAVAGIAALLLVQRVTVHPPQAATAAAPSTFGGPFTLVGSDGKPFSSAKLLGKPYVMYFGFTRCGDVCPTTLSRMARLREQAGGKDAFNIVFVTIDPAYDGPKQVGQYATLFNSPIIGLTGSPAQIAQVKKQYGIYAQPSPNPMPGKEMMHSAIVLLFDSTGKFVTTISPDEPDADALAKLKHLVG
jgi:protein SCO1/2